MKTTIKLGLTVAALILSSTLAVFAHGPDVPTSEESLSRATKHELKLARKATARYHNIKNAIADGYVDIDVYFPHMGYHYLKPAILDDTFDPQRPELLVYADFGNGHPRLVALEYAVPISLSPDMPPEGFTGEADVWSRNEEFGLWTLHAWVWYHNPDGVFAAFNERVPE
jgi:hypothetical protein